MKPVDTRIALVMALLALLLGAPLAPVTAATPGGGAKPALATNPVNELGFHLYGKLRSRPGNLFFSPWSISTALAMAYEGARGDTATEMARVLSFPSRELTREFFHSLTHTLTTGKHRYELRVANSLWIQKGYKVLAGYVQVLMASYNSQVHTADFKHDPAGSCSAINSWVSGKTKGKIQNLLANLNPVTRLVLVNAVYLKATWAQQFYKESTSNQDFWLTAEKKVQVPMMHDYRTTGYAENSACQVLALPYQGGLTMLIILPRQTEGLMALEASLSSKALTQWVRRLRDEYVNLTLPTWKAEQSFSLIDNLKQMGLKLATTPWKADFSGMAPPQPDGPLYIDAAIHKAFVKVDERGTVAAAAISSAIGGSSGVPPSPKVIFKADHPFMYFILDRRTGSILFMGRLSDPGR